MAVADVEVFKGTNKSGDYNLYHTELFEMASFFSQSNHFNVIDSYTKHYDTNKGGAPSYAVKRWKGDPIGDDDPGQPGYKVWASDDDIGSAADQTWIVVECQTEHPTLATLGFTGLPKWQMKIQANGDLSYMADPSDPTGVKYSKNHNTRRILTHRMGPYGGWNKADSLPDFVPSSPPSSGDVSTGNHREHGGNSLGRDSRWVQIHANGTYIRLSRYNDEAPSFYQVLCIVGDVLPISTLHMPNPRCVMGNGSGFTNLVGEIAINVFLTNEYTNSNLSYSTNDSAGGGIAFWDKDQNLVESRYAMDRKSDLEYHAANPFPGSPELEVFPVSPIPLELTPAPRHMFSWPWIRRGRTFGTMLLDSSQWLSVGATWGPLFPWDGSSLIY